MLTATNVDPTGKATRDVVVTFRLTVTEDTTPDEVLFATGAAEVQYTEPVLSDEDDGETTFGKILEVQTHVDDPHGQRPDTETGTPTMTVGELRRALAPLDSDDFILSYSGSWYLNLRGLDTAEDEDMAHTLVVSDDMDTRQW